MDVYRKVLVKLYDATGGKDTQTVDFKELVKNQGFLGNYEDIFQFLSSQGWIAETSKANFVKITHWGSKEAQKSAASTAAGQQETKGGSQDLTKEAQRLLTEAKSFLVILEEFAGDTSSKEKFSEVEKKFGELGATMAKIKENL